MKANELKRQSRSIESIYKEIENANANTCFKIFIPHFIYVDDSVKLSLMEDGFKVSIGNWNSLDYGLIIEW